MQRRPGTYNERVLKNLLEMHRWLHDARNFPGDKPVLRTTS
ncbi:MAG: hypothetical protein R3C68_09065 [Myxococcota bacterium]